MRGSYLPLLQAALALSCILTPVHRCLAQDASGEAPQTRRPNIVVLFADDAGYADFGFQASVRDDMKKLTPHIDSIARAGVTFTNA